MNEGWKCPSCGKCNAPWVASCDCYATNTTGGTHQIIPACHDCGRSPCVGTGITSPVLRVQG